MSCSVFMLVIFVLDFVICSHLHTCYCVLRWLVIGHPFELATVSGWKKQKASLHTQLALRHQNWPVSLDCFFCDGQGHEYEETQPSVFISVSCPLTCT
jgi:hypothetical protein